MSFRKKGVFKFLNQFAHFNHQFKVRTYFTMHATTFWILFSNLGIWIQGTGLQDTCHQWHIFQIYLEDKDRKVKSNLTVRLILWFNLRLKGYSIWSAIFIAPCIKEDYSRYEHAIASRQSRKYSEDTFNTMFGRTQRRLQKYTKGCSARLLRARGLVRLGATGLHTWQEYSRIRDVACPIPYTCCTLLGHE
jgi:hypothetical protein